MEERYTRLICSNRKAGHEYHLLEKFEAGIVLKGTEVKSLRTGKGSLKESYAAFEGSDLYLIDMHIPPYDHGNIANHQPTRKRRLLLHKQELKRLMGKVLEKGLTLIPTRMYFKGNTAKVEIALAQGKKLYDKRQSLKRKQHNREVAQVLKEKSRR